MNYFNGKIFAILLFCITFMFGSIGDNKDRLFNATSGIDFLIIPSLMDYKMDAWYKTPRQSTPDIKSVSKVFKNQPFTLLLFAKGYRVDKDDNVDITYDFKLVTEKGDELSEDSGKNVLFYKGKNPKSLILSKTLAKFVLTDKYKYGKYKIIVTLHDNIAKKSVTKDGKIELVIFPKTRKKMTNKELGEYFMGYYQNFYVADTIEAFLSAIQTQEDWIEKNLHLLNFFRIVFLKNDFLFDEIAKNIDSFSIEDQKKLLLIKALCNNKTKYSTTKEITTPIQLDMLWAEFFATGKYEPIKKLVLSLDTNCPKKDINSALTCKAAKWSIKSNAKNQKLILDYLITIKEYEKISKNTGKFLDEAIRESLQKDY